MLSPFRSTALTRPGRQGWNDDFFSDTFDPLNTQQIMNNFMEQAMAPGRMVTNDLVSVPTISMDVVENDKNYTIHFELPGFRKEDMKLTLANDILTISAEKRRDDVTENANWKVRERRFGRVSRQLPLPFNADEAHITSKFEDGVLAVEVPKSASHQQGLKSIAIQ